jgi:hypothetical protein
MAGDASDYAFWRAALKGEKQAVQENNPQCGFYRRRLLKDGPWLPIAFWRNAEGEVVCGLQGKLVDPVEHWTYAVKSPITEECYRTRLESGIWQDGSDAGRPPLSNMPADPFEALKLEVDDKIEQAESWLQTTPNAASQTDADMARNMQAGLLALNKRADALFKAEKLPITEAGRAVDAKFRFRETIAGVAAKLRSVFETFLKEEERRQAESARRAFEEKRKAAQDARRKAEEEQARLMTEDPALALISEPEPLPELPLAPAPAKLQAGGGTGRKAGLKTEFVPVIEDYPATLKHFEHHAEIRAAVEKLVRAEVRLNKAQSKIPGVKVVEERRAA